MASRRPIIRLTGRGRHSGILASSAAVSISQRRVVVEEEEENKDFSLSSNVLSKSEIERSSRLIFAPSSTLSISNNEKNLAETITRIACSDSVQKAVLESMMQGNTKKNSEVPSMERLLLRVNRLESEIQRLKGGKKESEEEQHVHAEDDTAMSTTSMLQWVSVSAVVVIVSALAYRYLSADAAKGIVDGVRNWFFGGRRRE